MRSALLIATAVVYLLLVFFYGVESLVFTLGFIARNCNPLKSHHSAWSC